MNLKNFSQDTAKVYFSGIVGREIRKSQLSDTSIKIVTTSIELQNCTLAIFCVCNKSQNIFSARIILGTSLGSLFNLFKQEMKHDCLDELVFDIICVDENTKNQIVLKGEAYKIIAN